MHFGRTALLKQSAQAKVDFGGILHQRTNFGRHGVAVQHQAEAEFLMTLSISCCNFYDMGHIPGQSAPLLRCNRAGRHKCCGFCRNAVNDAQSDTAAPAADIAFVGMRMIVKHGRVKFNLVPVDIDK